VTKATTVLTSTSRAGKSNGARQDTAVPLEARLLRDAQGKMIFIGDCAPLSFLQTVRQLIATKLTTSAELPAYSSHDSVIEVRRSKHAVNNSSQSEARSARKIRHEEISDLLQFYYTATSGLVDFLDDEALERQVEERFHQINGPKGSDLDEHDVGNALLYLIIAIGLQHMDDDKRADFWFERGRRILLLQLDSDMTIFSVRGFALVSVFMLRGCQLNAAYLNFGMKSHSVRQHFH
jgi:hypothetical protein